MLQNAPLFLMAAVVAGSFFSYRPTIGFGRAGGANLEVSVTQLLIALLIAASVFVVVRNWRFIIRDRASWLLAGLAGFSTVSLLWTDNLVRGLLISGLAWFVAVLWISVLAHARQLAAWSAALQKTLFWTTLAVCAFAWLQIFGEAVGVPSYLTLLPDPYLSDVFGFARPTAFALEPQFLGSLLLLPLLSTLWLELTRRASPLSSFVFVASLSVLVATISRGALLAAGFGAGILIVIWLGRNWKVRQTWLQFVRLAGIALATIIAACLLLGAAAAMNTRDTIDGNKAVAGAVNHVSLGLIDLSHKSPRGSTSKTPKEKREPGYVEESTDSRLKMSEAAFGLWTSDWQTFLFGIGAGSFGATLHQQNPDTYAVRSIVNNQYLETAAELGLLGLLVFTALLIYLAYTFIRRQEWLFAALLGAYCVQWLFFSGSVNVLHLWLILALAYARKAV